MGCVSSKQAESAVTPVSGGNAAEAGKKSGRFRFRFSSRKKKISYELGASSSSDSRSLRLGNLTKSIEGEQVAAGWPAWLSDVAAEAINGWIPLRIDSFEKLEKIGQGTYSNVFRARERETGKIVALKKVRFDKFEPESVRFMAREILILRRLDHPNIIKLEGLITSRLSCSLYLVFEYMEHDVTGLLSSPNVHFSEPQVKCYMKQLLSGIDHIHSRDVMHRDIKGSNLLINNEGILKVADFGLANLCISGERQPLTSRVVTLWYRPPELLLGATDYGPAVDVWSVGCVFAELLLGTPVFQGRTEVEQLHKIFKLCGSPPEDYWKKSKLPLATLFKPHQHYHSCLWQTCRDLSASATNLIQTLLSVEPDKRGTASSALASEYITTKPYACDPSSLPVYPPSKEIDARYHDEAKRNRSNYRVGGPELRKPIENPQGISRFASAKVSSSQHKTNLYINGNDVQEGHGRERRAPQGSIPYSGPLQVSKSSGFARGKIAKDDGRTRSHSRSISRVHDCNEVEPSAALHERTDGSKHPPIRKQLNVFEHPDSFDASNGFHSQELSWALYQREKTTNLDFHDGGERVEFSGPLLPPQSHDIDQLLRRRERQIRREIRKSWLKKGRINGK